MIKRENIFLKLISFITVGTLFAATGEILLNLLIYNNFDQILFSMLTYPLFLMFVFFSSRILDELMKGNILADLVYYIVYAGLGLMIEWFVLHNAPWQNHYAHQIGMLLFWAAIVGMPRIFTDETRDLSNIQSWVTRFFVPFSFIAFALALALALPSRIFWIPWIMIMGYAFLNVFYIWYILSK